MRLAELSARSGLPTATIKHYLRVGLLPPGEAQSSTWARYDERHLHRLRLVRALTDVAGLSLEEVRRVVESIDAAESAHQVRGAAQRSLSRTVTAEPSMASMDRVERLLSRHGWRIATDSPHRRTLASALDVLADLDFAATDEILDVYVRGAVSAAEIEVARVASESEPIVAAERLVVGTLLYEPVILTLRRMAHEALSADRSSTPGP